MFKVNNKETGLFQIKVFVREIKDTVMQIEKAPINDHLRVSKASGKFCIPTIYNFAVISHEICYFLKK